MSEFDLTPLHAALAAIQSLDRSALLPALHEAQRIYGYIPEPAAAEIGHRLGVPLAEVHGVIDFYALFYRKPTARKIVRICTDPACALAGGEELLQAACTRLGVTLDEPTPDGELMVERAPCLGLCEHAPAVLVEDTALGGVTSGELLQALKNPHIGVPIAPGSRLGGDPKDGVSLRLLTANCGHGHPTTLGEYIEHGGYRGLKAALQIAPTNVIEQVKASGLVGRGGAAFPTGLKLQGAASASDEPKFIVCNADESEPGTFKDRVLLEEDPQRVLEGMLIAGYAIGAHQGYIYMRGEYPYAGQVMRQAIAKARQAGCLGDSVLGSGFAFDVELRIGAGAYICGEETALFESIEGKRGFPRLKPPFPTTHGLFGKPTAINNVETLCNLPYILEHGAEAYRAIGTEKSPGPKLFCVSGDVARPGLYEVPFGITLRRLLFDLAGGLPGGHQLQAVLFGGAAGAFTTPAQLDVPLTFEDLKAAGLPLGSGVVMIFDERRDLRDVLQRLGRFFAHESCGKCYPCQIGTQRQYEILQRVASGRALPGDSDRLLDVGWTMSDASLCGLGQTAASAVLSALQLWPELFLAVNQE
jgi:NADH-quinone oxidoreductase subunit F